MRYTHVFFDLDGTLADTGPGVKNAFCHALEAIGQPVLPPQQLDFVLGPPLYWSFHEKLGLPHELALRGVEAYRAHYTATGIWQCEVFAGMPALLLALRAAGVRLGVVTGKPEHFAKKLLEYFGLPSCFDVVVGTDPAEHDASKAHLLCRAFALAGLPVPQLAADGDTAAQTGGTAATGHGGGLPDPTGKTPPAAAKTACAPARAVMVGDRCYDIDGAKAVGIDSIGVLFGYGTREELCTHGATQLAATPDELRALLLG